MFFRPFYYEKRQNYLKGGADMDESICMGRVVRTLRRERQLSQFDVAYRAEINLSYYCKIERGEANPSFRILTSLLRTLSVSPVRFFEMIALEQQYFLLYPRLHEDDLADMTQLEPEGEPVLQR